MMLRVFHSFIFFLVSNLEVLHTMRDMSST